MSFTYWALFLAGLATFLSPCVFPLIPVMTANLMTSNSNNRWARLLSTLWFGTGFTAAFVLMGLGISALVSVFPVAKVIFIILSAVILGFFGLKMAGMIDKGNRIPLFARSLQMPAFIHKLPGGAHGFFIGSAFGLSWTPCVGPILGGVLTYVASQERAPFEGALLLGVFSSGIVAPLLVVAIGTDYLLPRLRKFSQYTPRIEKLAGYGLVFFSVFMLKDAYLAMPPAPITPAASVASAPSEEGAPVLSKSTRMLFFYTDSCPICYRMKNFLPEFEEECTSDSFQFVYVDAADRANAKLAAQFNIRAVPTISVIDSEGEEIMHLVGYQSKSALRQAAEASTSKSCSES